MDTNSPAKLDASHNENERLCLGACILFAVILFDTEVTQNWFLRAAMLATQPRSYVDLDLSGDNGSVGQSKTTFARMKRTLRDTCISFPKRASNSIELLSHCQMTS